MPRVLIVAYYFPPLGGIGSLRTRGFASYLPQNGWEPTVLAPAGGSYYRDPALYFPENRVIRSRSMELSRATKRVLRAGGDDITPAQPGIARRGLQALARRLLYFPDAQIGWYWPSVRAGHATMREVSFDAIFSSAYPVTAHLIARRLHRDFRIPWVAEYRDPFAEFVEVERGPFTRRRALRLERSIAQEASAIIMTSPAWADSHSRRWDRPVTVITNGCDGPLESADPDPSRFVLAHLGSLYPGRHDLRGAWEAICRLWRRERPAIDRLCFVGNPQAEFLAELAAYGLMPLVEVTGHLPSEQALDRLRHADALLLAGPKNAGERLAGWIPAKLFEYLATDLPVVYIGDRECDAANLLAGFPGCHLVDCTDVEGIVRTLEAVKGERHTRDVNGFTRRSLTARLAGVLDETVRTAPRSGAA